MRFYLLNFSIVLIILSACQPTPETATESNADGYSQIRKQIDEVSQQLESQREIAYHKYVDLKLDQATQDFTINYLNGEIISFNELRGKVVILDFWATWCGPCKLISPYVADVKKKFPQSDLVVIGLSYESKELIDEYAKKNDIHYDLAYNGSDAVRLFKIRSFPSILIFDKVGKLQYSHPGVRLDSPKAIEWQVDNLLKQSFSSL